MSPISLRYVVKIENSWFSTYKTVDKKTVTTPSAAPVIPTIFKALDTGMVASLLIIVSTLTVLAAVVDL